MALYWQARCSMTTCLKAICHIVCAMASMWGDVMGVEVERFGGRREGWVWRTWRRRLFISWVDWGAAGGGSDGSCVASVSVVEEVFSGDVNAAWWVIWDVVSMKSPRYFGSRTSFFISSTFCFFSGDSFLASS